MFLEIKNNFWTLLTVTAGIIAIVLQHFDIVTLEVSQQIMFALICLLATSDLIERRKKINELHASVKEHQIFTEKESKLLKRDLVDSTNRIIRSVRASYIPEKFDKSIDALNYIVEKVGTAERQILHASVSPSNSSLRSGYREKFHKAVKSSLERGYVTYKYVTVLREEEKIKELEKLVLDESYPNYYAGVYRFNQEMLPSIYFFVVDNTEVIIRYPNEFGDDDEYIKILDPLVVEIFSKYHKKLWDLSNKIRGKEDLEEFRLI